MLVGVEGDRFAVALQIGLQGLEIGERALRDDKAQLHQTAGRVVDEHQQRAGSGSLLEPAMIRPVDLDQLTNMLSAVTRLLDPLAFSTRDPDSCLLHPAPQRLSRDLQIIRSASFSAAKVGPKSG